MDWSSSSVLAWTSANVGVGEHQPLLGLVVVQVGQGHNPVTRKEQEVGVHLRKSELKQLAQRVRDATVHKRVIKVGEVPYLTTYVGPNLYVARSLLTSGNTDGQGQGLIVYIKGETCVLAVYKSNDDSRAVQVVRHFAIQHLQIPDHQNQNQGGPSGGHLLV